MSMIAAAGCNPFIKLPPTLHVRNRTVPLATLSPIGTDSADWIEATSKYFDRDSRPIMLFDGNVFSNCLSSHTASAYLFQLEYKAKESVCNLCNGGVKFVRDNDRKRSIRFEALQSEAGRKLLIRAGRAPDDISSVVLVEKDRAYIKSEAVLKIMEYIDLPFPQLAFFLQFVPLLIRDFAYDNIADNRYAFFGRSESCKI